jgi:hypothetical protein
VSKLFVAKIRWGTDSEARETLCEYKFKTQAELEAFLRGVDEASGWSDYELVEEKKA